MKILLIEDEPHKRDELSGHLQSFFGERLNLQVSDSVKSAIELVSNDDYDLIVLDMALPTFSVGQNSSDGGLDQALGGVEILRTLRALNKFQRVMIVTQYPDIFLGGRRVKIGKAQIALKKMYGQEVVGAVLYKYKSPLNRTKIEHLLRQLI
ncbi:response regulator [Celeribacter sp. ULVN23_4]